MENNKEVKAVEKRDKSFNIWWVPIGLLIGVAIGAIPELGMSFGIPVGLGVAALINVIITVAGKRRDKNK